MCVVVVVAVARSCALTCSCFASVSRASRKRASGSASACKYQKGDGNKCLWGPKTGKKNHTALAAATITVASHAHHFDDGRCTVADCWLCMCDSVCGRWMANYWNPTDWNCSTQLHFISLPNYASAPYRYQPHEACLKVVILSIWAINCWAYIRFVFALADPIQFRGDSA